MITLASRWSFSPLIYILRNWLKVEVLEAALLQICCSSCAESQLQLVMTGAGQSINNNNTLVLFLEIEFNFVLITFEL